jgi:DNA-binding PadR family transcriptional regulator
MTAEGAAGRLPLGGADFEVLLALAGGARHGYAIMQEVAERTGDRARLGPGTLYGAIKRLLAGGLIAETDGPAADDAAHRESRRYYRVTPLGREVAAAEAGRLAALVRAAVGKKLLRRADVFNPAG